MEKLNEKEIKENNDKITMTQTKIEYVDTSEFLKETTISMKKNKKAFRELAK